MPQFPMKTVMVSGHFDPFHDGHLSYIKQALWHGNYFFCVVSSDDQLLMKKGKVNIPERGRWEIVHLIMEGLHISHFTWVNRWDSTMFGTTPFVAEALRHFKPDIFFRGPDKTTETMPPEEHKVCEELGIKILYARMEHDTHGENMLIEK